MIFKLGIYEVHVLLASKVKSISLPFIVRPLKPVILNKACEFKSFFRTRF